MSMITKCPSCSTAFRVTPQQLQAHHGMVRCGRCATVFDGFKTLAAQAADMSHAAALAPAPPPRSNGDIVMPPAMLASVTSVPPEPAPQPVAIQAEPTPIPPAVEIALEPPVPEVSAPPPVAERSTVVDTVAHSPEVGTASTISTAHAALQEPAVASALPIDSASTHVDSVRVADEVGAAPRKHVILWALATFVLLLTLAAQGVYYFRGEIAAHAPEARPYLNQACAQLRCTVALPQRPQQIKIAASDVQATEPANPGLMTVTATLRSESAAALGYPALDVVLTNVKGHTVARRIFLPSEYLDAGKDVRAGIPPNAEFTVVLNIDSGELGAAGFRLDVLAAPNF